MKTYHKIQTVYKRNKEDKFKTILEGEYSLPEFEFLQKNMWIFTEKVDGTNIRIMCQGGKLTFGGKTAQANIPVPLLARLKATFLPLADQFADIFKGADVCLYGEGHGAKIQHGGGNYRPDQDFVLFDVKIGDCWLQRDDVEDVAAKLGIMVVPVIGEGTIGDMVYMAKKGFNSIWGHFRAEGIVARPSVELKTRYGERVITKIKCRDFS